VAENNNNARNLQQPPPAPDITFLRRFFFPLFFLWDALSQSRLALIAREFWVQSGNHVVPLDGALLFKIMFMLLVVSARMSRRTSDNGKKQQHNVRFYISVALMVVGFLWHTRYLQFMYRFFVQDNVPWRIWNGRHAQNDDPTEVAAAAAPPVPIRRAAAAAAPPVPYNPNDWRNTFLGGGIQLPNANQNVIVRLVLDIFYLFGSFVFSIFPMWRPEAPPPPPPPPPQEDEGGAAAAAAAPPPGLARVDNDFCLPQVQPPRDAMEAADDDE
jgi:hypothetical protein